MFYCFHHTYIGWANYARMRVLDGSTFKRQRLVPRSLTTRSGSARLGKSHRCDRPVPNLPRRRTRGRGVQPQSMLPCVCRPVPVRKASTCAARVPAVRYRVRSDCNVIVILPNLSRWQAPRRGSVSWADQADGLRLPVVSTRVSE